MFGLAISDSFGFTERTALCVGAKPNVPLVPLAKLFLKSAAEKYKKLQGGLSDGLLAVPLENGRYFGHLSKWFVFVLMFKFWSVSYLLNDLHTTGYNVLQLPEGGDFEAIHCQPSRNFD